MTEEFVLTDDMVNDRYEVLVALLCRLVDQDLAAKGLEKANRLLDDLNLSFKYEEIGKMIAMTQEWVTEDEKVARKAKDLARHEAFYAQYLANSQVTYFHVALEFYAQWVRDEKAHGYKGQELVDKHFYQIFFDLNKRVTNLVNADVEALTTDVLAVLEDMKNFRIEDVLKAVIKAKNGWLNGQYAEMFKLTSAFAQAEAWLDEEHSMDWVNRGWDLVDVLEAPWGNCPTEVHGQNHVKLFPIRKQSGGYFLPKEGHVCGPCAHARKEAGSGSAEPSTSKLNASIELRDGALADPAAFDGITIDGVSPVTYVYLEAADVVLDTKKKPRKPKTPQVVDNGALPARKTVRRASKKEQDAAEVE